MQMQTGTIKVRNGHVVSIQADGHGVAKVPNEALDHCLENIKKRGWVPVGDLPPFTTDGAYEIPIQRPDYEYFEIKAHPDEADEIEARLKSEGWQPHRQDIQMWPIESDTGKLFMQFERPVAGDA